MSTPMTFQEFQEQALRLHKRFPHTYPYRKQVELAFHLSGLPLEWFKVRVDYILKSGTKHYDWIGSARGARSKAEWEVTFAKEAKFEVFKNEVMREISLVTGVSYEDFLKQHQAGSALEVFEKMREGSKDE